MNENERVILTFDEAIKMLPEGEHIHTFRGRMPFLVGATWNRQDILDSFKQFEPELSGDFATSINHGIVFKDHHGWVFVETKENENERE